MKQHEKLVAEALHRADGFAHANPIDTPEGYGEGLPILDGVVVRVTQYMREQQGAIRQGLGETQRKRALVAALRQEHLRPIAAIASAVLAGTPGMDVALRMPRGARSVTRLVAEAGAVRDAVAPHAAVFVKHGRPADFVEKLDVAIRAVVASEAEQSRLAGQRATSRVGLEQEIARGRKALAMLDALVRVHFKDQPTLLAAWATAKRVQRPSVNAVIDAGSGEEGAPEAAAA